jgi:hypothetical protein
MQHNRYGTLFGRCRRLAAPIVHLGVGTRHGIPLTEDAA